MSKETKDLKEEIKPTKKTTTKAKSSTTKKASTSTKKTTTTKKATTTKKTAVTKKEPATKKKTSTAKNTTKKSTSVKKVATTKKAPTKKTTATKKATSTKKVVSSKAKRTTKKVVETKPYQTEYYDLPYSYNKTVVKVLAQTPKTLFVYWEISEKDRNKLKKTYGDNFFEITKPVLIIYNDTLNYSYEIDINDFANSWYIHINDSKCDYRVELGRRPLATANQNIDDSKNNTVQTSYIPYYVYLTSSNEMTAPNNRILFNPNQKEIKFRNVKTGQVTTKDIRKFKFITNWGIFTIQDLYKYLYPNEDFEYENFFTGNPSSGNPSSGSLSSRFR